VKKLEKGEKGFGRRRVWRAWRGYRFEEQKWSSS